MRLFIHDMNMIVKTAYSHGDFVLHSHSEYPVGMGLKEIRKAAGLTQEELAEKAGVSQAAVSRIEKMAESVTLRQLKQVAEALGVSPSDLLSDRGATEAALVRRFRQLSPDQQKLWIKLLDAATNASSPEEASETE